MLLLLPPGLLTHIQRIGLSFQIYTLYMDLNNAMPVFVLKTWFME